MKINKNGVLYESVSIMTRVSLLKGLIIIDIEFGIYNRTYIFHGFLRKLVWVIPYDSLSEPWYCLSHILVKEHENIPPLFLIPET